MIVLHCLYGIPRMDIPFEANSFEVEKVVFYAHLRILKIMMEGCLLGLEEAYIHLLKLKRL